MTAVQSPLPLTESPSDTPSGTVLFVDDEENILWAIRRTFRSFGPKILLAQSGSEGLEVLAREHVDVVVSDMRMPGMDGARFLEQVADRWPDTVRVLMSGYADLSSTVAAVNKGRIFRYISKPWVNEEVRATIGDALALKRAGDENVRLQQKVARLERLAQASREERASADDGGEAAAAPDPGAAALIARLLERAADVPAERRAALAERAAGHAAARLGRQHPDVVAALIESLDAASGPDAGQKA